RSMPTYCGPKSADGQCRSREQISLVIDRRSMVYGANPAYDDGTDRVSFYGGGLVLAALRQAEKGLKNPFLHPENAKLRWFAKFAN
ncbi:MAG TPA: hypothetical protein VF783_16625, partial [Terriglobales bacterium]